MARVTVEDCLDKVPNRFALVILAAERARQLSRGATPGVDCDNKPAVTALRECGKPQSPRTAKKDVLRAVEAVAGVLGNTKAVCRSSYIHPAVLEAFMSGTVSFDSRPRASRVAATSALRPDEEITLALLRRLAKNGHRRAA